MIDQLLAEQYALYNENPQNLDVVRKIARLHEQKDDIEGALQYYSWAVELTKNSDPGIDPQGQRPDDEEPGSPDCTGAMRGSRSTPPR